MKKILLGILMVLVSSYAFAGPIVLFGSDNREKGTVDNPLYVTGGSGGIENNTITGDFTVTGSMSIGGDTTISGTLQASAANILGVDEVMSFSDGNSIDGNKTPGYITIDDLMVTSSDTTLGNAFRVQDSALATKFTVLSNGNVGFGTTLPKGTIDIRGVATEGVTSGDVTFDPVSKTLVVGRLSGTALDNSKFIVQNRLGSALLTVDGVGSMNTSINIGVGTTSVANAGVDVGGFTRTYIAAVQATSIGVKGSIEADASIYSGKVMVDDALYIRHATTSAIYIRQPDNGCSKCSVDAAGTTWACVDITCSGDM